MSLLNKNRHTNTNALLLNGNSATIDMSNLLIENLPRNTEE